MSAGNDFSLFLSVFMCVTLWQNVVLEKLYSCVAEIKIKAYYNDMIRVVSCNIIVIGVESWVRS